MANSYSGVRKKLRQEEGRLVRQTAAEEHQVAQEQTGGQAVSVDEASGAMVAQEDGLALETVLDGALLDVRHALHNLDGGTYGICEDCGQAIPAERLAVRPQATLCLPCKTRRERGHTRDRLLPLPAAADAAEALDFADGQDPYELNRLAGDGHQVAYRARGRHV